VQVFAELGAFGALVWAFLFGYAVIACLRVRARASDARFTPQQQRFYFTAANGLLTSIVGFMTGGAFLALALNDLTWLTFGMVAALELMTRAQEEAVGLPKKAVVQGPLAFRIVESYAASRKLQA
jgi:O-antigen ligase